MDLDRRRTETGEPPAVESDPFLESFEAFYRRERDAVIGLAYVLSGSRAGAEDLAQDAFVQLLRSWDRIKGYDNPGAWVRRVVVNRSISIFRRRTAEARALVRFGDRHPVVPDLSPDTVAIWTEVRRLPRRQAQTLALRYVDDLSVAEIARILECSENTVNTHLKRSKATLSRRLTEDGHDEDDR